MRIHSLEPGAIRGDTARSAEPAMNLGSESAAFFAQLQEQLYSETPHTSAGNGAAAGTAPQAAPSPGSATSAEPLAAAAPAVAVAATATPGTATAATPARGPATVAVTAPTSDPNATLTAEQVFGSNPWLTSPTGTGPNGLTFGYNDLYFATAKTAGQVAQMVGGKVVEVDDLTMNTPGDVFAQSQPNEMVELPDGALINPGLIASLYTHGYPNWIVNQAIANEVAGDEAAVDSGEVAPASPDLISQAATVNPADSGASTPAASSLPSVAGNPQGTPDAEQVFGPNPWLTNPAGTGPNGLKFSYNPLYFATVSTAEQVAQMVGGKVVEDDEFTKNTPNDPFAQSQPNEMVELPDGALINPGLIASLYTHGYSASLVQQAIANEVAGAEASVTAASS